MSEPSALELAIKNHEAMAHALWAWMKYFTIGNGALFTALGFLLTWEPDHPHYAKLLPVLLGFDCLLGIALSCMTTGVAVRQLRWVGAQRKIITDLQEKHGERVFPKDDDIVGGLHSITFVSWTGVLTVFLWLFLLAFVTQR